MQSTGEINNKEGKTKIKQEAELGGKNQWKAVRLAQNRPVVGLQEEIKLSNGSIVKNNSEKADKFSKFFETKVNSITNSINIWSKWNLQWQTEDLWRLWNMLDFFREGHKNHKRRRWQWRHLTEVQRVNWNSHIVVQEEWIMHQWTKDGSLYF